MKQILDVYRLVKLVSEAEQEIEDKDPTPIKLKGFDQYHPATATIKYRFKEKYKKSSMPKINRLVVYAINKDYLGGSTLTINGKETDTLCLREDGDEFLDKFIWFIPIGLLEALWDKHGKFVVGLSGVIVGVLGATFVSFARWLVQIIINKI